MASTHFTTGTTITSEWLNDVNDAVYEGNITAEGVQYTPPFTGGVTTNVENKLAETVSVKDFGAVGDGVTDDSAAIIDALTYAAANSPKTLYFPSGVYLCDTPLGDFNASNLTLEGQDATLDFSNVATSPAVTMLSFTGTAATAISLSSTAAEAQKTVAATSSTFAAGDFVKIYSDTIWDSGRTSSKYGELNFIGSVPDSASVVVTNDLMSTYTTTDSAKIQKLTPVRNINICGLKLQGPAGNDNHKGIVITYGVNCTIDGIQSYDMDAMHVQFIDSTFCRVTNSYFQESNAATTGYGNSFTDATQDCSAENNVYTDVRHSMTTNNSSYGITRRILFSGNIVTDSALATGGSGGDAIDAHAGAEDISIIGNIVNAASGAGINVECRSATIADNSISFTQGNGITHQNYTDLIGWTNISNNTIRNVLGSYGIAVVPNTYSFGTCVINGNDIDITAVQTIRARPTSTYQFVNLNISGNSIRMTGTSTNAALDVEAVLAGVITGNSVQAPAIGIRVTDGNSVAVTGNSVRLITTTGASSGYAVRMAADSYGCVVSGNAVYNDSNLTAARAVYFDDTVTYSGIFANVGSKFTAGTKFDIGSGTGNVKDNNIEGV